MERHYIDESIQEKLEGLEINPPVEAWVHIADALDKHPRHRFLPLFLRVAASLAVLAVAVFSFWLLMPGDTFYETSMTADMPATEIIPMPAAEAQAQVLSRAGLLQRVTSAPRPVGLLFAESGDIPSFAVPRVAAQPIDGMFAWLSTTGGPVVQNRFGTHLLDTDATPDATGIGDRVSEYFARSGAPSNIRFGAHFAPAYNYRLLAAGNDFAFQTIPFEALEERIMTFGAGFDASYRISPAWSVQTGMGYVNTGQYVKDIMVYAHPAQMPLYQQDPSLSKTYHPQTIITSQGSIRMHDPYHYFADVQSYRVITNKQTFDETDIRTLKKSAEGITQVFRYLEVPLVLRYHIVRRDLGLQLKGGVAGNYLMQNEVFAGRNTMQKSIGETYGVRQLNVSAIGGLSLDIPLTGRLVFHFEPTAQIFLSPVSGHGIMTGRAFPYSYSVRTGLSYGL